MDVELARTGARVEYNKIENPVWCKALHEFIFFTAKGFHHLLYDGLGSRRSTKNQLYKLKFIPYIQEVIENGNITSYRKILKEQLIEYWSVEATVNKDEDLRVRVIFRKVENGKIVFWSVMGLKNKKNLQ